MDAEGSPPIPAHAPEGPQPAPSLISPPPARARPPDGGGTTSPSEPRAGGIGGRAERGFVRGGMRGSRRRRSRSWSRSRNEPAPGGGRGRRAMTGGGAAFRRRC